MPLYRFFVPIKKRILSVFRQHRPTEILTVPTEILTVSTEILTFDEPATPCNHCVTRVSFFLKTPKESLTAPAFLGERGAHIFIGTPNNDIVTSARYRGQHIFIGRGSRQPMKRDYTTKSERYFSLLTRITPDPARKPRTEF